MTEDNVRVLVAADGERRVRIVRRGAHFSIIPERYLIEEADGRTISEGWAPSARVASFFADVDGAEEAARSRYNWLNI